MSFLTEGPEPNSNLWVIVVPMLLAWALILGSAVKVYISSSGRKPQLRSAWPLLLSLALTLAVMILYSGFVSEYWSPEEQNWKFEFNGIMLSQSQPPLFAHSCPHGSSLIMAPFFLIFGPTHLAVVLMNALALLAAGLFTSLAVREITGDAEAMPTVAAGPLLVSYFPIIAIWGAGGEYTLFLAALSAAVWLMLRSLRDSSAASLILCGATVFLSTLIRVEGFFLWLLWPFALLAAGRLDMKKLLGIMFGSAASLTLILIAIRHIAFGDAGKPILRLEHIASNSGWLALYLSDGIVALLLVLPGLAWLARRDMQSAFTLLCLCAGYGAFWLSGPSFDRYQISTQIYLPLCILAATAFGLLQLKNRKVAVAAVVAALTLQALPVGPAYNYLSDKIGVWQKSDRELRLLADQLDKNIPVMSNLPHLKMTAPQLKPFSEDNIGINDFAALSRTQKIMACFSSAEKPDECLFTRELFSQKDSANLLEPQKFGYSLQKSIRSGDTLLNIYSAE